jgi:hypothetical protein
MLGANVIRHWDYKGVILEVKHIRIMEEARALALMTEMGDLDSHLLHGHHCGYATIAKNAGNGELANYLDDYGHPDIEVHGGVTFFVDNGETVTYGFDCAHYNDSMSYWDAERVSEECQKLANQLRSIVGIDD